MSVPDMFNKQGYAAAKTPTKKTLLQRQIDRLVYELYGLTEAEIRIVEAG